MPIDFGTENLAYLVTRAAMQKMPNIAAKKLGSHDTHATALEVTSLGRQTNQSILRRYIPCQPYMVSV